MALGSVTSLGVGSGFELQDILDQLREADEVAVNIKKIEKTRLEEQVVEFDSITAKLIQMKSSALSLSLESNFLERSATVTDEEIVNAGVVSGTKLSSYAIEVTRLASKSSWQSIGIEEQDSMITTTPATGIETTTEPAVTQATALSFTIGHGDDQKAISMQIAAGSGLKDIADAINTHADNLDDTGTSYVTATVETGTDGSYIRLSATDDSSLNNNQILVSQGPSFITPDLMFSYQTGATSDPVYVAVPPGTSYQGVASIINDDPNNSGVTAAMVNDGSDDTPWHLTITADTAGENNRISFNGINLTEVQGADGESLNALFSVDGYEYQRQTNEDIDDVIMGVTLDINKVGDTQLTIASEQDTMKDKITQFVDTFNELIEEISSKSSYGTDEKEESGILHDVYSIKTLGQKLINTLTSRINTGGAITSATDLGITVNNDGSISLDQDTLDEAFTDSPEDVADFFIGDSEKEITGLGDILNEKLKEITQSDGLMDGEKSAAQGKIDRLAEAIEIQTERLDKRYDLMAQQFVRLDAFIGTMNAEADYLSSMIEAFNNTMNND